MADVESVLGTIDTADLGPTLMHEHVCVLSTEILENYGGEWWDEEPRITDAVAKLKALAERGIKTIVDPTVIGLGRYIPRVKRVAEQVPEINIIPATGLYTFDELPHYFHYRGPNTLLGGPELLADLFIKDIREGIADTGVKAAFLKCVVEEKGLTEGVERVARAVAQTHRETGVPITSHTAVAFRTGLDQQRIFAEEGVDLQRVVIGHSGDSVDFDYLRELLDAGSFVGADRFGLYQPGRPSREQRIETVARLCELGYAGQVVLAHDKTIRTDWYFDESMVFPQEWHQTHLIDDILPALAAAGVTQEQMHQMTVENPRRVFAAQDSY